MKKRIISIVLVLTLTFSMLCIPAIAADNKTNASDLSDKQRNSIDMLNYLAFLTQEITASKNSRLFLEDAYSSLLSNTYPNAVDYDTQEHISDLLDQLEEYRLLSVKRERLEYIFQQNQARAMRAAMPNPVGLLSAVQSYSLDKLLLSVAYMAIDAKTSYDSAQEETKLEYLRDRWTLDDEEAANLHDVRKLAFVYMLDIVRNYDLPGDLALSESAIEELVKWENNTNIDQRIRFLESNQDTYEAFGQYWLILASSYYENVDYANCLNAVSMYEQIQTRIFRKDYEFAKILPMAIVAAEKTCGKAKFVTEAEHYLQLMVANCDNEDWALRYFAAQTYVDLYAKAKNRQYLESAYELALDNVNVLVNEQRSKNSAFLADIQTIDTSDMDSDEKKEAKNYNKMLEEARETELPPVNEALILNCDLLFELAKELDITETEKKTIMGILRGKNQQTFLVKPLDAFYSFDSEPDYSGMDISFHKAEVEIPAEYVTEDSNITVTVSADGKDTVVSDWTIDEVDRNKSDDVRDFTATFKSKSAKKVDFPEGCTIIITVSYGENSSVPEMQVTFVAEKGKVLHSIPTMNYKRVK